MLILSAIIVFFFCIFIGLPIFFSFGLTAAFACMAGNLPLHIVAQRLMIGMDSFVLLAVPGFVLAGEIMCQGGISKRIVDFCNALVGHFKGGLSMVAVLTGMIMGGISGSAVADTAAVASVLVPSMEKENYPKEFSAAVVGTAGPLGNIIPPSIPMVIYSMTSGLSLLDLFLAGYIPGMMIGFSLMGFCHIISKNKGYGRSQSHFSHTNLMTAFRRSVLAILIPVVVVGGIVTGVFTPTESSIIAVVYSFIVAIFVYREMTVVQIPRVLLTAAKASAKLVIIMGAGSVFSYISINEGVPELFRDFMLGISNNKFVILMVLNLILLFTGLLIDILVATIIFVPILMPLGQALGLDPLHVAMLFVVNMSIGLLTPPVGYSLYVSSIISGVPTEKVALNSVPIVLIMIGILSIMTLFPQVTLFVPNLIH
ncbi:MAG: TRAP transporter large permease [Syntrophaceae bacterium]|nr:TRAP transporter large permease [Syntrophaceae bacterium]